MQQGPHGPPLSCSSGGNSWSSGLIGADLDAAELDFRVLSVVIGSSAAMVFTLFTSAANIPSRKGKKNKKYRNQVRERSSIENVQKMANEWYLAIFE